MPTTKRENYMTLVFIRRASSKPQLTETSFWHKDNGYEVRAKFDDGDFEWTRGVQAFSIFALRYAAWGIRRRSDDTLDYPQLIGERNTPASSLSGAIGKKPAWIRKMFGKEELIDKIISIVDNRDFKKAGPVKLEIVMEELPPHQIEVRSGSHPITTWEELEQLADKISADAFPNGPQANQNLETLSYAVRKSAGAGGAPTPQVTGIHAGLPQDVQSRIDGYQHHIARKDYPTAFHEFFMEGAPEKSLNYLLDFVHNRCKLHFELVEMLFANGVELDPPNLHTAQQAKALNALARAYKNTGQLNRAIATYERQISAEFRDGRTELQTLQNYVNALRLAGRLREACKKAYELLKVSKGKGPKSVGYALYWTGVIESACGRHQSAEALLRRAEIEFESIKEIDRKRGLGRTCAHLALLELTLGNIELADCLAKRARQLAEQHDETRERIFTNRLQGTTGLMLGNVEQAERILSATKKSAQDAGYVEEELAATIALAEVERRRNNLAVAEQELREVEFRATELGYVLLRVDALNALTWVIRDQGLQEQATETALNAYDCAQCDGSPFVYDAGLRTADQHLKSLGATPRRIRTVDDQVTWPSEPFLVDVSDPRSSTVARRCEYYKFMRIMTGPYRYRRTKFLKLLQDDWDALCRIIKNEDVTLPPEHVEIHVGDPCNLYCVFCRGLLRKLNRKQRTLSETALIEILDGIHAENPNAFIRFSGVIGEPLLPPYMCNVFHHATKNELPWGVTTNGILMTESIREALMNAEYVHVSLDAGSDRTYHQLKERDSDSSGNFERVLENIALLSKRRNESLKPEIVVSLLLQSANFRELWQVSQRLKDLGVDNLEIKMQHFDQKRHMTETEIVEAYGLIDQVRGLEDSRFRVVVVQSKEQALEKVREDVKPITFSRCYANMLGLNATVDATGNLQTCCQYYQKTLGLQGPVTGQSDFGKSWNSPNRSKILDANPRQKCVNCSPSDEFVNKFVDFLREETTADSRFLNWVRKEIEMIFAGQ